jgi:hypothetical protein
MTPLARFALAVAGFLALAASLFLKKKAGWAALVGAGALGWLALDDADPVLALGVLALLLARRPLRPPRDDRPDHGPAPSVPAPPGSGSGQAP